VQVDLTYPMDKILLRTFDAYLYLQYFNGWGETLRTYDERLPWQVRVGLAVVRWGDVTGSGG
jgi:outer membrane phospholipase A